jgi:hypothetical protein
MDEDNKDKISKEVKFRLAFSLIRYFFSIAFSIVAPIFFIFASSERISNWIKYVVIYVILPALMYYLLRFFYKRKLKKFGLNYDPLGARFSFMKGGAQRLIDDDPNQRNNNSPKVR